jgi:hypothetical protein
MSAIISDQFRILNAETFVKSFTGIGTTTNVYYTFIGLPNSTDTATGSGTTDWNTNTPSPKDMFKEQNDYYDTMLALKKITTQDVRRMVRKVNWNSSVKYDMYRHDYNVSNLSPVAGATNLYDANYYVVNTNFQVYICLQNGIDPEHPTGQPSLDEPTFTDLEPRAAGSSGDGYIWKYLFTISPNDIIKFDSLDFIPVPSNWGNDADSASIKNNAISGEIKIVTITNRGSGYSPAGTYKNIPILGDGTGGRVSISVGADGKVSSVDVTNGGSQYTRGTIQFYPSGPALEVGGTNLTSIGLNAVGSASTSIATFDVIIPPSGGHGYDVYKELGAYRVLVYSRYENTGTNPDFIVGNDFARVGIVKNPTAFGSKTELLSSNQVSALGALKLTNSNLGNYNADTVITQTIGIGSTAVAKVASYDGTTGVLKYYQPVGLAVTAFNYKLLNFKRNSELATGGALTIFGATSGSNLEIQTTYGTSANPGVTTSVGNRIINLDQNYVEGIANPEVEKYSGEIIYIDNRAAIPRSFTQKEDIKIVLEF